jgi:adenylylsulfate kinase
MNEEKGFAVWITGIPASGKSSITRELVACLNRLGISPSVLESDAMRRVLTPQPSYDQDERDRFYLQLADLGTVLAHQGLPVIFDATANRRAYRDHARTRITRFVEVFVDCTIELCVARDPKGLYQAANRGIASHVPGLQAVYEPPLTPEVTVDCRDSPSVSAERIIAYLKELRYI